MNLTLEYLKTNRKWLAPNLIVWGNADACSARLLMTETGTPNRVVFAADEISGLNQTILYSDLVDSKGNSLPEQIANPIIIIIPRNQIHCFLIGQPSSTSFKIGRTGAGSNNNSDGLVDILIMEVDLP